MTGFPITSLAGIRRAALIELVVAFRSIVTSILLAENGGVSVRGLWEGRSETPPGDYYLVRVLVLTTLHADASFTTFNRYVVGAHVTTPHQSIIVELPVLVAVCAVPKT